MGQGRAFGERIRGLRGGSWFSQDRDIERKKGRNFVRKPEQREGMERHIHDGFCALWKPC